MKSQTIFRVFRRIRLKMVYTRGGNRAETKVKRARTVRRIHDMKRELVSL